MVTPHIMVERKPTHTSSSMTVEGNRGRPANNHWLPSHVETVICPHDRNLRAEHGVCSNRNARAYAATFTDEAIGSCPKIPGNQRTPGHIERRMHMSQSKPSSQDRHLQIAERLPQARVFSQVAYHHACPAKKTSISAEPPRACQASLYANLAFNFAEDPSAQVKTNRAFATVIK